MEMLVPLDQLTKTVKGMKSEGTIGFIPDGKDKVKLRYSIAGNLVERRPSTPCPPTSSRQCPRSISPAFRWSLGLAWHCGRPSNAAARIPARHILNGACLDVTDKKFHYVVGTNGRCLFSANSFCFDLKKSVVIPDSKFLEWPDLLDEEPASLSVEPGEEAEPAKNGKPAKEATAGLGEARIRPLDLHHQGDRRQVPQLETGRARQPTANGLASI